MNRAYNFFEEVESEVAILAPPVVYKFRTWKDDNHKSLLTDQHIWFSHPFELNDPLDVRPETVFDINEFADQRYYEKLLASAAYNNPDLKTREQQINAAKEQWEFTKDNPQIVSENYKNRNSIESNFNSYGIFSTGMDELSVKTWEEYGDNHAGYCIGFNTVELCRKIKSSYGYVTYSDDLIKYTFFNKKEDSDLDALYYKKLNWKQEKEFRFITLGIGIHSERLQKFSVDVVTEIILGYNISDEDEKEILELINSKYPEGLPVYKTKSNENEQFIKYAFNNKK